MNSVSSGEGALLKSIEYGGFFSPNPPSSSYLYYRNIGSNAQYKELRAELRTVFCEHHDLALVDAIYISKHLEIRPIGLK